MARFGDFDQYLDDAGDPLVQGKLYFYESGTTTPKTTYADINNSIPNTNPVLLSAAGRQPNIFFDGVAKVILTDNNDVQIAVRDPAGETGTDFGDAWVATKIYSALDVVLGSDGIYYRSLVNGNQNNNPVTSTGYWTLLYSIEWNAGISYKEGSVVTYDGEQYQSLTNSNLNNNPSTSPSNWTLLSFAWISTATYADNQNAVGSDGILYTSQQAANTGNDPTNAANRPTYWVGTSADAAASAAAAAASETAAAASEAAAAASETAAAASETAAAASETAAASSASAASTSATNAASSASAASTSETNAAASETAAAASASAASTSETNAAASASAASTSETNAAASETAAAASETAAAASESAAATSETNAASSASAASTSATNASTSETNAASSATAAASSATAAAGSATAAAGSATDAADKYDEFDDRYLGEKASDPTLDNDGNALITGALYFNTSTTAMKVYTGSVWQDVAPVATSVTLSQVTDFPSQSGQSGKYLSTNGTTPSWETLTTDPTLGTLTKTFTTGESSTINLSSSVLAPVVSVTKEVPQSGVTNNSWDVNSTTENYTRLDSAYDTTLDFLSTPSALSGYTSGNTLSTTSQEPSNAQGLHLSSNGLNLIITGITADEVYQYSLSTAWDLSTASYVASVSVAAKDTTPYGCSYGDSGNKLYVCGGSQKAHEYNLSTPYDVSTATFVQSFTPAWTANVRNITFKPDGTKMYLTNGSDNYHYQYTLSTPWDLSTASYDSISGTGVGSAQYGITFNDDGLTAYTSSINEVYKYTLSTAWDISTLSYTSESKGIGSTSSKTFFSPVNNDIYVLLYDTGVVQYDSNSTESLALGTGSFASADVGKTIEANSGEFVLTATDGSYVESTAPTSYAQVASGSWEMYGVVYNAADGDLELSSTTINTFDVSTAVYSQSFSVAAQDTGPVGLAFNTDGTKMFVVGGVGDDVYEYVLTTGFDVSTASYNSVSFDVSAQDTQPQEIAFNTDGTKMFIVGFTGQDVNEYALTTGFDVSTASFTDAFSVAGQDTVPMGLAFNTNGTKMFISGSTNDAVYEYNLSTGFDISTASFVDSFSVSAQMTNPRGLAFSSDGTKMFVVDLTSDDVNEYALTTGFDVSTASFTDSFSVSSQDTNPNALAFSSDGTKMFVVGGTGDDVNEYSIGTLVTPTGYHPVHTTASTDTTYWTDINSMTADQAAGDGNVYYAISTDDRTTWTVIDNTEGERDIVRNNGGTWQYNSNGTYASETWVNGTTNTELATLAEAMEGASRTINQFDISTAVYSQNFSISAQETQPNGIAFNTNGTKMFVVGATGDDVNEYTLSTGFEVSTASFVDSFSVAAQETNPFGIAFNSDGTKMFIVGGNSNTAYEYTLSAGFDISTATYSQAFSVASQDTYCQGIAFNATGTKMFIVGSVGDSVYQYTLSAGFDLSTASYDSVSFSVASQDTSPSDIVFNTDGTKMFIVGDTGDDINEYALSTGFDVSTASYSQNFSIASQDTAPRGITFNPDGSKMFIVGAINAAVYEYSVGTPVYINQMDKAQLDAVTDPNHIALGNDLDLSIIFNMTSGTVVPSSDGVAINYDANVLNKGAVLGTDYDFDAPAPNKVRITALAGNNLKVRVV